MIDYKLICWNDYSFPVPNECKWLAMDYDNIWYVFTDKPIKERTYWTINFDKNVLYDRTALVISEMNIQPPQPGPWEEQLYWIGDE